MNLLWIQFKKNESLDYVNLFKRKLKIKYFISNQMSIEFSLHINILL